MDSGKPQDLNRGWGGELGKLLCLRLQQFNLHAPDSVSIISTDTTTTTTTDTDAAAIPASIMAATVFSLSFSSAGKGHFLTGVF